MHDETQRFMLGEIVSIRSSYTFRRKIEPDFNGNIKVIQMKDIDPYHQIDFSDVYTVDIEKINQQHLLKPGDILLRTRGISENAINEAVLVPEKIGQAVANHLTVLRPTSTKVDSAYLVWYLNQPKSQHYIKRLAVGSGMKMISNADLKNLSVVVPPLQRQKLIAKIAQLSQEEHRLLENINEKRRTYINALLMQEVTAGEEVN